VAATSQANSAASAAAAVTVTSDVVLSLSRVPSGSGAGPAGSSLQLNTVLSSAGHPDPAVTWTVNGIPQGNASVGTIVAAGAGNGVYTAPSPAVVSSIVIVASSLADPAKSATLNFPLVASNGGITLSGTALSFPNTALGTFSPAQNVLVTNSANGPVTFSSLSMSGTTATDFRMANNCPGPGGILPAGASCNINVSFQPTTAGNEKALLSINHNLAGSPQQVTIQGAGVTQAVSIAPLATTVQVGNTVQLLQTVTGLSDSAANWAVNGISGGSSSVGFVNSGVYNAPSTVPSPNTVTVTVSSAVNPALSASATVTLVPVSVAVLVRPVSATVPASKTEQFFAQVTGATNTAVTWDVNGTAGGNATVGTIDANGLYTAPATPPANAVTVHATAIADSTAAGSATITVAAGAALAIASMDSTALAPFQLLTLRGSGFDPEAAVTVTFNDSGAYSVNVVPVVVKAGYLVVGVPPYVDNTGALSAGSVTLTVNQTGAAGVLTSNAMKGFQIQNLPVLTAKPGSVTTAFLQGMSGAMNTLRSSINNGYGDFHLGGSEIAGALAVQQQAINALLAQVSSVMQTPGYSFTLVNSPTRPIKVSASDLAKLDRIMAGAVTAWAAGSYNPGAVDPPDCAAEQAMNLHDKINALLGDGSGTPILSGQVSQTLSDTSTCAAVQSTTATLNTIGAGGAVGVGLLGLAGPDEAALAAAAGLMVFNAASTAALTSYGGYIAQGTAAGQQALQGAAQQFNEVIKAPLEQLLGGWLKQSAPTAGHLYDLYGLVTASSEFYHGLIEAPPNQGGPVPASTKNLNIANAGSGQGTVVSLPGGIVCGNNAFACSAPFPAGSTVFLSAQPGTGSVMSGFTPACGSGTGCQLTMNADQSITANFAPAPAPSNATTFTGSLSGSVRDDGHGGCNGGSGGTATMSGTVTMVVAPQAGGGFTFTGTANVLQSSGICDDYSGTFSFSGSSENATIAGSSVGFSFGVGFASGTFTTNKNFTANWSFSTNVGPDEASGTMSLTAP